MIVDIPDDWQPTSGAINALPFPLRKYIHDLETNCGPAGIVRENALVQDENRMLRAKLEEVFEFPPGRHQWVAGTAAGYCGKCGRSLADDVHSPI